MSYKGRTKSRKHKEELIMRMERLLQIIKATNVKERRRPIEESILGT